MNWRFVLAEPLLEDGASCLVSCGVGSGVIGMVDMACIGLMEQGSRGGCFVGV